MNAGQGAGRRSSRRLFVDVNVTPLVDVSMVLLIIFMVAAPMIQQGVEVSLPKVVAAELPAKADLLIITVHRSGSVSIGKTPVQIDALPKKLTALFERRQDKEAFLKADKDVPYGVVARVMAAARLAGIERLGMVTEAPD